MVDRLEYLEERLMKLWDTHKELAEVMEYFCEVDYIDPDEAANLTEGIMSLLDIRLQQALRSFDQYTTELAKSSWGGVYNYE